MDPVKVTFNFSSYFHTDNDKSLFSKCLNFPITNKKVKLLEYTCFFELLFHEGNTLTKNGNDEELLKSTLKKLSLCFHYRLKESSLEENLSKKELESLKKLSGTNLKV